MSYSENLIKDNQEINYFIRVGSRRYLGSLTWTLAPSTGGSPFPSNTYYFEYDGDQPYSLTWTRLGIETKYKTLFRPGPNVNQAPFSYGTANVETIYTVAYFDKQTGRIYVYCNGAPFNDFISNPSLHEFYIEELHFIGTRFASLPAYPTDTSWDYVNYRGSLVSDPSIVTGTSDIFFGYSPMQTSSVTVADNEGYLIKSNYFNDSQSNCVFEMYRCIGDVYPENMQLVFKGFTRSISVDGSGTINISYVDSSSILDDRIKSTLANTQSQLDMVGNYNRVYGAGYFLNQQCYCSAYSTTKTTSTNRTWVAGNCFVLNSFSSNAKDVFPTTDALVASNTVSRTYIDNATKIQVGTQVQASGGGTSNVYTVTTVGANYIDTVPNFPFAQGVGDYISICAVQDIVIRESSSGALYSVPVGSYTVSGNSQIAITFKTSLESDVSLPTNLSPEDYTVHCDVVVSCGTDVSYEFPYDTSPLGQFNGYNGICQNPVQILFELLYYAGFFIEYDSDSWHGTADEMNLLASATFMQTYSNQTTPTYREVIAKLCESFLMKFFMKNGEWFVGLVKPLGNATYVIEDRNIISVNGYQKLSDDLARYFSVKSGYMDFNTSKNDYSGLYYDTATEDNVNSYLTNRVNRTSEKFLSTDWATDFTSPTEHSGETMARRYSYVFSKPFGIFSIEVDYSFFDITLNDIVEIDGTNIASVPFTGVKKFSITSITEKRNSVVLELFDQEGVEQYSADWDVT